MLGSPAGPGGTAQRGFWPLTPTTLSSTTNFTSEGYSKYGIYSFLPGSPTVGSALYSHNSIGRFTTGSIQSSLGTEFHAHKDSIYASSTGYTFGAPTPPPGSPYSPVPVTQFLAKGFNSNIIVQQQQQQHQLLTAADLSPCSAKSSKVSAECAAAAATIKPDDSKCCKSCVCCSPAKNNSGCSRTNPIDWNAVNIKKEPCTESASCIKLEACCSPNKPPPAITLPPLPPVITSNGSIPVGIAVARQRVHQQHQQQPEGLLTTVTATQMKEVARVSSASAESGMAATNAAGGGTLMQCPPDDRSGGGFVSWPVGGSHNSAFAPTLWQYPAAAAAHLSMEPLLPMPVPIPPVGFQLVRDHTTGGLLLLPTTAVGKISPVSFPYSEDYTSEAFPEQVQQTVVWPSYHSTSSHVMLPPAMPPPPLQLLGSSDYLQTSNTTLHQHTHSSHQSTRLLTLATGTGHSDKKVSIPASIIKIESEVDQNAKTLQAASTFGNTTGTVYANQNVGPLVTTHVIYQHPSNMIVPQTSTAESNTSRSQSTSPVACLTPPPESSSVHEEEVATVQDASNQTDAPDDAPHTPESASEESVPESVSSTNVVAEVVEDKVQVKEELDFSGLELLSNSIAVLEDKERIRCEDKSTDEVMVEGLAQMTLADPPAFNGELGGLDLLCALAEQRIKEEDSLGGDSSLRSDERKSDSSIKGCTCKAEDSYKTYKTKESEQVVKKFLASKSQTYCCKGEWPCMNAMELDMRMKLADLQRKYREKQKELNRLKPKKCSEVKKCRARKRSYNSDKRSSSRERVEPKIQKTQELLKPPTLELRPSANAEKPPECSESSKKRKVGRPKKLLASYGLDTETIVAKKPKKLINYLLEAKEETLDEDVIDDHVDDERECERDEEQDLQTEEIIAKSPPCLEESQTPEEEAPTDVKNEQEEEEEEEEEFPSAEICNEKTNKCTLTREHLEESKLRVLTAMGGLFYAGRLNAVEPPDVYSITLDGERGNRPHIMSREEILRDAILEIAPLNTEELTPGTRLCAYWSQQYRCLYPGSVADPESPNSELDSKFVSVEFDDGDSGRIALEDIRLLPPDYPIIEYDPNPLLSLCKRRRRTSTTEERRSAVNTNPPTPEPTPVAELGKENLDNNNQITEDKDNVHKERKKLKKKKRDRKSSGDEEHRKKRKKHKCPGAESCKHRKHHKKHRKHKRYHHSKDSPKKYTQNGDVRHKEKKKKAEIDLPIRTPSPITEIVPEEPEKTIAEADEFPETESTTEVTLQDILESKAKKSKKFRDRQESCESRSKMSAFLPARQLWGWSGKGYKRPKTKGRSRKQFFRAIQRGKETIQIGDSAVFLSTGRPDRPYIGRIEAMWESCGTMVVRVKWFYHPEETVGRPLDLKYPGALFESPHVDENDVQTISHKCEVLPLKDYVNKLGNDPKRYATIYDNNDIYYLAGHYDPTTTTLKMELEIPINNK